jgi:hypothetical protein
MWILSLFLLIILAGSAYTGSLKLFTLDKMNPANVLNSLLVLLLFFTLLIVAYSFGYFPQSIAAPFMMIIYTAVAGFFFGYAFRLFRDRSDSGTILYQNRSFWVDHAPNLLAAVLIVFGFYRTSILTDLPVTGIRVTSGLSLIGFGLFNWTLKAVPEFRSKGVLLLDRLIHWPDVISWHWHEESVLAIEYTVKVGKEERIKQFTTAIPVSDRKEIEMVLKSKMDEFADERQDKLFNSEKTDY